MDIPNTTFYKLCEYAFFEWEGKRNLDNPEKQNGMQTLNKDTPNTANESEKKLDKNKKRSRASFIAGEKKERKKEGWFGWLRF